MVSVVKVAAVVVATGILLLAAFQLYWALGGTGGLSAAWGGEHRRLPRPLRIASAVVTAVLILGGAVVLSRAGLMTGSSSGVVVWGTWIIAGVLALSTLANAKSKSRIERRVNAPLAAVLALLCGFVAAKGP